MRANICMTIPFKQVAKDSSGNNQQPGMQFRKWRCKAQRCGVTFTFDYSHFATFCNNACKFWSILSAALNIFDLSYHQQSIPQHSLQNEVDTVVSSELRWLQKPSNLRSRQKGLKFAD